VRGEQDTPTHGDTSKKCSFVPARVRVSGNAGSYKCSHCIIFASSARLAVGSCIVKGKSGFTLVAGFFPALHLMGSDYNSSVPFSPSPISTIPVSSPSSPPASTLVRGIWSPGRGAPGVTATTGVGSRRAGVRSGPSCHTARRGVLPAASCFWGRTGPL
jgi:hypothetical protein